jgi:hypothetical protein
VRPIIPPSPSSFSPLRSTIITSARPVTVLYTYSYPSHPQPTSYPPLLCWEIPFYFAILLFYVLRDSFRPFSFPSPAHDPFLFVIHRYSSCVSSRPQSAPSIRCIPLHPSVTCLLLQLPPDARPHRRNTPASLIYFTITNISLFPPPEEAPLHLRVLQYNICSDGRSQISIFSHRGRSSFPPGGDVLLFALFRDYSYGIHYTPRATEGCDSRYGCDAWLLRIYAHWQLWHSRLDEIRCLAVPPRLLARFFTPDSLHRYCTAAQSGPLVGITLSDLPDLVFLNVPRAIVIPSDQAQVGCSSKQSHQSLPAQHTRGLTATNQQQHKCRNYGTTEHRNSHFLSLGAPPSNIPPIIMLFMDSLLFLLSIKNRIPADGCNYTKDDGDTSRARCPKEESERREDEDSPGFCQCHDAKHVFGFGSFRSFTVQIKMFPIGHGQSKSPLLSRVRLRLGRAFPFGGFFFLFSCQMCECEKYVCVVCAW